MTDDVYAIFKSRVRTKLILCLRERPKNVSELIATCGLAQSAVSQHLKKLKDAGLVTDTRHGKEMVYTLTHKKAARISELLLSLSKEVL